MDVSVHLSPCLLIFEFQSGKQVHCCWSSAQAFGRSFCDGWGSKGSTEMLAEHRLVQSAQNRMQAAPSLINLPALIGTDRH